MNGSRRVLAGVVLAVLPVALLTGAGTVLPILGAVLLLGLVATGGSLRSGGRRGGPDVSWASDREFSFVPAEPSDRSSPRQVTLALARVESGLLFPDSLAFVTGIGFSLLVVALFGVGWSADHGGETAHFIEEFPVLMYPLAGMTIAAAHRARTRGRRDGVEELYATCPAADDVRNAAHTATLWVPAVAATVTVAALLGAYWLRTPYHWGPFGARQFALLGGSVMLPIGATALGVALARWAPWQIAPVVAIVVIGLMSLRLADNGSSDADGVAQLSLISVTEDVDVRFTAPHWAAHHLWVLSLVAITAILALWRRDRVRVMGAALTVAAVAAFVTGYVASRPTSDSDVARIVSLIAEPDRHQSCTDVGIVMCIYDGDYELVDAFRPHVGDVLAAIPAGVSVEGRILRQGALVRTNRIDDEVASRLPPPAQGVIPVVLNDEDASHFAVRFWVAFSATGIAADVGDGGVVDLSGQARGVLAIWLATRGLPEGQAVEEMASIAPDTDHGHDWWGSRPWPDSCIAGPAPVTWALSDLAAARALIGTPEAEVMAAVHANWRRLIEPSTTTNDLLSMFGFYPSGPTRGRTPVSPAC